MEASEVSNETAKGVLSSSASTQQSGSGKLLF